MKIKNEKSGHEFKEQTVNEKILKHKVVKKKEEGIYIFIIF